MYERGCYNISITNNVFSENSAQYTNQGRGGAIAMNNPAEKGSLSSSILQESRSRLINNTFYSNTADYEGGAFHYNGGLSPPLFLNNIFWENFAPTANDINNVTGETIAVFYSNIATQYITGPWEGDWNINEDPGFIDTVCHIDGGSPCFEIGIDSLEYEGAWYYSPNHDFEGDLRPYYSGLDIGADEYAPVGLHELNTQHSTLNTQIYPNPTRGISHFAINISQYQYVTCKIYDLHGREVAVVLDEKLPAGDHIVQYDMSGLPDGIYLVRLTAGQEVATGKILLVQ
jgi:hypothetical protein